MTEPNSTVPYGYCRCGCGGKTRISPLTNRRNSYVKGEPQPYILGHKGPTRINREGPNPGGLCMCGCGEKTKLAPWTHLKRGMEKDKPMRYLQGHRQRTQSVLRRDETPYSEENRGHGTPCWIWHCARDGLGYGVFSHNGRRVYAHRYYYQAEHGPIPGGRVVHHKCGEKSCCRPAHLELLTNREHFLAHFKFVRRTEP